MENEFRQNIVKEAINWVDVKYVHRGDSKRGADCSGLIVGILKQLGFLQSFVIPIYPPDWNLHKPNVNYLKIYLNDYCYQIDENMVEPGDLAVFKFGKHVECSHLGILINRILFVHSLFPVGVKYGTLHTGQWKKRLVGYFRIDEEKIKKL